MNKTWKTIIEGVVRVVDGVKLIDTKHSIERFVERNGLKSSELSKFYKDVIVAISGKPTDVYLVYSKSLNQAIVVDKKNATEIKIVTFLPRGRSNPKDGTAKIVVEGYAESYSQDFIHYIERLDLGETNGYDYETVDICEGVKFIFTQDVLWDCDVNIIEIG